jgi:hypothetical protein
MKRVAFVLSIALFAAGASVAQDDWYSCENLVAFADHLFSTGEYGRAIGEYLRAAALSSDEAQRDSLWLTIGITYLKRSMPAQARGYCDRIMTEHSIPVAERWCFRSFSYYLEGCYDSVPSGPFDVGDDPWVFRQLNIRAASLLKQYRWQDAELILGSASTDSVSKALREIARQGSDLHLKRPVVAGILSAIVPGSGKWYAHRGWDGLVSMLTIGTMAWQSFEGYRKDGPVSVRCMLFGGLGGIFYVGNIYGSTVAARQYNRSKQATLADRVDLRWEW